MNGPPQEGLDPKLKVLTELAPAEEEVAGAVSSINNGNDDPLTNATAIAMPEEAIGAPLGLDTTTTTYSTHQYQQEHPPQVGQDPKLLACVNDGEGHDEDVVHNVTASTIDVDGNYYNGVHAPPLPAAATMPVQDDGQSNNNSTAPPSPTKATVAATMLSIQRTVSSPPNTNFKEQGEATTTLEQGEAATLEQTKYPPVATTAASNSKAPPASSGANSKQHTMPNLTSSESLAEWNRIHANDTTPSYNFFQKKMDADKMRYQTADYTGTPSIEELIESSRGRPSVAAGAIAAASGGAMKTPLFMLDAKGNIATMIAPTVHTNNPQSRQDGFSSTPAYPPPTNHVINKSDNAADAYPPSPALPAGASAVPNTVPKNAQSNSNFWLQEEEERFLLGLRLYGWGQWKRIQTIVQTRTNKQIKSHAQKREKVNPSIKSKYGKGKQSRRGRISSKVLAEDARAMAIAGGSVGQVANAILSNDATIPSLDQAWRDVYGTNNGDGPNSRVRRYRGSQSHERYASMENMISTAEEVSAQQSGRQQQQQQAIPLVSAVAHQLLQQDRLSNPIYKQPQPMVTAIEHHNHRQQSMEASQIAASGTNNPNLAPPPLPNHAPTIHPPPLPPTLAHDAAATAANTWQDDKPAYSSNTVPVPASSQTQTMALAPTLAVPIINDNGSRTNTNTNELSPSGQQNKDTDTLRPGMRIYSRNINDGKSSEWIPGIIYSAKVDPAKQTSSPAGVMPLIYHIQHDNGNEEQNVPEEHVMSKSFYEEAILHELEQCHALPSHSTTRQGHYSSHPLEMGTPVYCQWTDMYHPEMHGRWLPGTIHSYRQILNHDNGINSHEREYVYHVLFDNEQEKLDVSQRHVLDRTEYHELTKLKYQMPPDEKTKPIGEIYNLFLWKEHDNNVSAIGDNGNGINGQNSDSVQQPHQKILGSSNSSSASHQGNVVNNDNNSEHQKTGMNLNLLFTASQIATNVAESMVEEEVEAPMTRKRELSTMDDSHDGIAYKRRHQDVVVREQEQEQTIMESV
mmetsp:Transcript_1734/g.3702  ORF Transcript_1734/g.3702 Transcript_1734/m.3702 type:complete len:1023 (+) Transcript_1734:363-3431(+)|eukprot:CAMPEP_0172297096 /NCGR_PEP_ID=MMETSP1058-20130122/245_1 /TAXON_ID=83371 /ORGANISM="Detonula confervacea, Strain CCMP 353" /LENGTH=1022 /DNA_ID=CAMNT_0013006205 /DNA_START=285 /DNA_END=3350 /DNA_ORIENTATION=-